MFESKRTNAILYCQRWAETVNFYRDLLKLEISFENDWFVEFQLNLTHPKYKKPELLATGPNEVWLWDITKLKGPKKMDLLLPLRNRRHLQPLRCRLDAGSS